MSKVWFITGASKGFGREWAEAALERGDRVAATARRPETLEALVDTYGDTAGYEVKVNSAPVFCIAATTRCFNPL